MKNDKIRFPIYKPYFIFIYTLTTVLFSGDTGYLIFGKPTSQDLTPMIIFDVFYLLVSIFGIRSYFIFAANNYTALELNEDEIVDHVFKVRVNWHNVSDVRFKKRGQSGYISIYVTDKKEVIRQAKSIFKKMVFYIDILFTGAPVRILPMYIKGKNSEIFDKIYEYYYKNGFGEHIS